MSFELHRFAWSDGALELSGRWTGERRRFRRVRLVVDEGGRERRIAPRQATSGDEAWSATFPWDGPEAPLRPALELGHDLLIELPAPDRAAVLAHPAPEPAPALAAEVAALREQLAAEHEVIAELRRELEELRRAPGPAAAARRPVELPPREPADPVRGPAPLPIRLIAVALTVPIVIALAILLSAIV